MFNIQKAVSRLDSAPKLKEIQITDIKKGIGVFTPKPEKSISFLALKQTLKKAGYTLDSARIILIGTVARDSQGWSITVTQSGQRFILLRDNLDQTFAGAKADALMEIHGGWTTVGEGTNAKETITVTSAAEVTAAFHKSSGGSLRNDEATFTAAAFSTFDRQFSPLESPYVPAAPIRVTSPGLTVYKGGAITPRLYLIKQHLGKLKVERQLFDLSASYTPSTRLQLEVELPVSHTAFNDGATSGGAAGLGNIDLWVKYRFFRTVKTYGDRQAAFRFGLELPTGRRDGPTLSQLNAPAYVRQQLSPINGGLSPHLDVAFSQAGGRFIFGGNAEGILRTERQGFRVGHEVRFNTDTEYVFLPRNYQSPGRELFLILESTFVHRSSGRNMSLPVPGSSSTEYYVAPGLQYAAASQFVIEGSFQLPIIRNTGSAVLRTDRNLLLGVKYLF